MIPSDPTRFVLVGTSHAGNVGAAARAMKVMGFSDLVLVRPRHADVLVQEETVAMASGAADLLVRARIVANLDDALDGITHACATAMTPRDFGVPARTPRAHFTGPATHGKRVAFVFGSERYGLSNEDVWHCHACLSIPTADSYGSLNLAQAVQLVAYDWRQAIGGQEVAQARLPADPVADMPALNGLLEHWRQVLDRTGYLDPAAPRRLLPRLRRFLHRAQPTASEVQILRGIARSILEDADRHAPVADASARLRGKP